MTFDLPLARRLVRGWPMPAEMFEDIFGTYCRATVAHYTCFDRGESAVDHAPTIIVMDDDGFNGWLAEYKPELMDIWEAARVAEAYDNGRS